VGNPHDGFHQRIINPLKEKGANNREKLIARSLHTLSGKRRIADYFDTPLGNSQKNEAKAALELSQRAWDQLDALYKEPIVPFAQRPKQS
jgi:hypothetical protein